MITVHQMAARVDIDAHLCAQADRSPSIDGNGGRQLWFISPPPDVDSLHDAVGRPGDAGISLIRIGDVIVRLCARTSRLCTIVVPAADWSTNERSLIGHFTSGLPDALERLSWTDDPATTETIELRVAVPRTDDPVVRMAHLDSHKHLYSLHGEKEKAWRVERALIVACAEVALGVAFADEELFDRAYHDLDGLSTAYLARALKTSTAFNYFASRVSECATSAKTNAFGHGAGFHHLVELALQRAGDLNAHQGFQAAQAQLEATEALTATIDRLAFDKTLVDSIKFEELTSPWIQVEATPNPAIGPHEHLTVWALDSSGKVCGGGSLIGFGTRRAAIAVSERPADFGITRGTLWPSESGTGESVERAHLYGHAALLALQAGRCAARISYVGDAAALSAGAVHLWLAAGYPERARWALEYTDRNLVGALHLDDVAAVLSACPPPIRAAVTEPPLWLCLAEPGFLTATVSEVEA